MVGARNVIRLATLTLASGLLGTTAAMRPQFLALAVLGPIALWWRWTSPERALLVAWIPALWAGLAVYEWTSTSRPAPIAYLLLATVGTVAGLVVGAQLLQLWEWWLAQRLQGGAAMLAVAAGGPRALAAHYGQAPGQPGGHVLARGAQGRGLVLGQANTHTLLLGPTRMGKTSGGATPNVMAWTAGSVVCASSKQDIFDAAGGIRATLGQVYVLDVLGTLDSHELPDAVQRVRWTPLRGCKDWNAARARAKALLGPGRTSQSVAEAGHWATQGELLLAPLLHVAALCGLTLREVVAWAANPDQLEEPLGLLQEFDGAAAGSKEAHAHLRGVARQEAKHRSNVVSTVTTALHPYSGHVLEEAAQATDADWDPEQFLSGLNTLFVIAPVDSEVDSPAPIVVGVLSELYGAVRKLSDANGGHLLHPTLWVLDEVANICPLPALPQWLAEAAGRGLTFVLGVQDYAQLSERWGRDGATAMWSNTTTKVVFPGIANPDTLRQLELLGGQYWIPLVTTSMPAKGSRREKRKRTTMSTSHQQLPRWTVDALYGMAAGSCLVFRPDWPTPCLQPQSRAHLTQPFATWQRLPWPLEERELRLAGRAAVVPTPREVPPPPPC